jgi:hypothetical protein
MLGRSQAPRVLRVAVLAVLAILGWAKAGWACSCAPESAEQGFRRPGAVFVGTVIETDVTGPRQGMFRESMTRVRVNNVIKGAPGTEVLIGHGTDGASCGVQFRVGQMLTFFTDLIVEGRTTTGYCSQMFAYYRASELRPVYARFRAAGR